MIKVNLAKGLKNIKAGGAVEGGIVDGADAIDAATLQKTGAIRGLGFFIIPILLFVIESQTIPSYQSELAQKQKRLVELQSISAKGKDSVAEIKKFKEQQARLQAQVNSIEQLKKDRLREVRILDTMQKEMPEKLWLSKVDLKDGKMNLAGVAGTDPDLTAFMDVLSRSAYLKEVNLIRSNEYATSVGVFKKFEILCLTER